MRIDQFNASRALAQGREGAQESTEYKRTRYAELRKIEAQRELTLREKGELSRLAVELAHRIV